MILLCRTAWFVGHTIALVIPVVGVRHLLSLPVKSKNVQVNHTKLADMFNIEQRVCGTAADRLRRQTSSRGLRHPQSTRARSLDVPVGDEAEDSGVLVLGDIRACAMPLVIAQVQQRQQHAHVHPLMVEEQEGVRCSLRMPHTRDASQACTKHRSLITHL